MASRKRDLLSRYKSLFVKSIVGIYIPSDYRGEWSALARRRDEGLLTEEEAATLAEIEELKMEVVARKLTSAEYDALTREVGEIRRKELEASVTDEAVDAEVARLQSVCSSSNVLSEYVPESLEDQLTGIGGEALLGNWEASTQICFVLHPNDPKAALVRTCLLCTMQDPAQIRVDDEDVQLTPEEIAELYPDDMDSLDPDYQDEIEKRRRELYTQHKEKMREQREVESDHARARLEKLSEEELWRKIAKGNLQAKVLAETAEEHLLRAIHLEMVDPEKKRTEAQRRKYGGADPRSPMFTLKELREIKDDIPDLWEFLCELHEDLNAINTVAEAKELCRLNPFRRTAISHGGGGRSGNGSGPPAGDGGDSVGPDDGSAGSSPVRSEGADNRDGTNGSELHFAPVEENA